MSHQLTDIVDSSKWMFTLSVIAYGIIMMYMTFAGGWLAYRTLQKGMQSPEWDPNDTLKNFNLLMNQSEFRDVVISLLATYGLYILSSLFYMDPWHMITSFVQYLFLLPTYVNILNVYAFCNIHDVRQVKKKGDRLHANDLIVGGPREITQLQWI